MWCQHRVLTWSQQYFWNKSLNEKWFWKQSEPLRCRLARDTAQFPTQKWPHKKGRWERRRVHGGRKSEILSNFFYVWKWSQKASHIIHATFLTQIRPSSPILDPILRHAEGNLAVFWPHHAQKTAIFSKIRFHVRCDVNIEFSHGVSNIFGINP